MKPPPSYADIAVLIAETIYRGYYREEPRINLEPIKTFNTMFDSSLQLHAYVFTNLDIVTPLDDAQQRFIFTCEPSEIRERAQKNKELGCSYDTLVSSLITLAEYQGFSKELFDYLVRLELCEEQLSVSENDPVGVVHIDGKPIELFQVEPKPPPTYSIKWKSKKEYYDTLSNDWDWPP